MPRVSASRVAMFVHLVATGLLVAISASGGTATQGCPDIAREGNLTEIDEFSTADAACTVPALDANGARIQVAASSDITSGDAYVKHSTYVYLDAHARSSGVCDVYNPDGGGGCALTSTQIRYIGNISMRHTIPSGSYSTYVLYPVDAAGNLDYTKQNVDTRAANTTVPDFKRALFYGVGKHVVRYSFGVNVTACNIQPNISPTKELDINVTACRPEWQLIAGASGPRTPHLPGQNISIYVDPSISGMISAVESAISDWNPLLNGTGLSFTRVPNPCSGAACINVVENQLFPPPGDPRKICADYLPGPPDASGQSTGPGTLTMQSATTSGQDPWTNATEARRRRTINHELAHALGLDHNSCAASNSVLAPSSSCTSATGMTVTPTANDSLAVTDGVYGSKVRKTCGF